MGIIQSLAYNLGICTKPAERNHWKMPVDVPNFIHTELNKDKKYKNIKNYSPTNLYYSPSLLEKKRRLDYLYKSFEDRIMSETLREQAYKSRARTAKMFSTSGFGMTIDDYEAIQEYEQEYGPLDD